jgi:hypothetical protein
MRERCKNNENITSEEETKPGQNVVPPLPPISFNKLHVTIEKKNCVIIDNAPLHENQKFGFILKEHCRSHQVDNENEGLFYIPLNLVRVIVLCIATTLPQRMRGLKRLYFEMYPI